MKKELRKDILEERKKLDEKELKSNSAAIEDSLLKMREVNEAKTIALYHSKDNEVLTQGMIERLLKQGKRVCLPRVIEEKDKKKKEMEFRMINSLNDLEPGFAGIMEPKKICAYVPPSEIDLVIMPCVAVDKKLNRLGKGGGMYDSFLAEHSKSNMDAIKTICLAHGFQLKDSLPVEEHDKKADAVVTEKGVIRREEDAKESIERGDGKTALLMDGKAVAKKITEKLKQEIIKKELKPCLAVILVGEDPASESYVKIKSRRCEETGIRFMLIRIASTAGENEVLEQIEKLNCDKAVCGIIVQLPLPDALREATDRVINSVLPEKDVDGLGEENMKKLAKGDERLAPCTPKGIIKLLEEYGVELKGKKIVVVGRGRLVGKPLAIMLESRHLDFEVCHTKTKVLEESTSKADILISATGVPNLITEKHIKKGAVVVDAGTAKQEDKLMGDVDFKSAIKKASLITPNPGGVGPMTVAMLMRNVINAYKR